MHIYIYIHSVRSALSLTSSNQLHQDVSTENQQLPAGILVFYGIIVYLAVEILFSTTFSMLPDVELHVKDSGIIIYFSTLKISCG